MPDKPSIYGKAYDQLNALAQKCEALDLEVRTLRAPVNGRRKDVDYAFDGAKDRLSEVLLETLFVMNTIKEEYEDNERERGPRLHAYQDMIKNPLAAE